MNYLASILLVLACVSFSTQDNGTLVDKKENVEININDKPTQFPGTISDIHPEPHSSTPLPPTNSTTMPPPPTNSTTKPTTSTTPITKPTTKPTTTISPKPTPTTSPKPTPTNATTPATNSTTEGPTTASPVTVAPTTAKPAPEPEPHRRFDGPSFIGGIVLALGLCAIGFVGFKFYKARLEVNYHTL